MVKTENLYGKMRGGAVLERTTRLTRKCKARNGVAESLLSFRLQRARGEEHYTSADEACLTRS